MPKLTFNRAGWIVIAIEENNYFRHIRFDTKAAARAFLKANPDAWFVGWFMTIYKVYNLDNQLISAHDNAASALKQALIYQHTTGRPAFVESEVIAW